MGPIVGALAAGLLYEFVFCERHLPASGDAIQWEIEMKANGSTADNTEPASVSQNNHGPANVNQNNGEPVDVNENSNAFVDIRFPR